MQAWKDAYQDMLNTQGGGFAGVGYSRRGCLGQYWAIREVMSVRPGSSVVDMGSGLGYGILVFPDCDFWGIDAVEKMVSESKRIHACDKEFFVGGPSDIPKIGVPQYCVLSGIFNICYEWTDICTVVKQCFSHVSVAVGISYLRKASRKRDDHTIYPDSKWIELANSMSNKFILNTTHAGKCGVLAVFKR